MTCLPIYRHQKKCSHQDFKENQNIGNLISSSVHFHLSLYLSKRCTKTKRELNVRLMFKCALPFLSSYCIYEKTIKNFRILYSVFVWILKKRSAKITTGSILCAHINYRSYHTEIVSDIWLKRYRLWKTFYFFHIYCE